MAWYSSCAECQGSGAVRCTACICGSCSGKARVACSNCQNGRRACSDCSASGRMRCAQCSGQGRVVQTLWVFKQKVLCPTCYGAASVQCPACGGRKEISCASCRGTGTTSCGACAGAGVQPTCETCGRSRKVVCSTCKGVGRFETDWSKELKTSTVKRLRFEYEKRQRQILALQIKISSLRRELDEMYSWYERDRVANPKAWYHREGSYPSGMESIPREIEQYELEVRTLEEQMDDIQTVLDSK